ncbi:hypothetical protein E2C01_002980 [Portunus trituberculatus]|uniref:Uncharacterized protein n=1 Tax=Portunus trituberculatus TaxID=210409 RepID=A0A5B7CPM3_PORTR|nr:hypothetical protein [Portunus trituberculatus]
MGVLDKAFDSSVFSVMLRTGQLHQLLTGILPQYTVNEQSHVSAFTFQILCHTRIWTDALNYLNEMV